MVAYFYGIEYEAGTNIHGGVPPPPNRMKTKKRINLRAIFCHTRADRSGL
jgi:hypothetical protein